MAMTLPFTHAQKKHSWFTREEAHNKRVVVERYWKTLHAKIRMEL
jgi:hypothetical protein